MLWKWKTTNRTILVRDLPTLHLVILLISVQIGLRAQEPTLKVMVGRNSKSVQRWVSFEINGFLGQLSRHENQEGRRNKLCCLPQSCSVMVKTD